jgi:SAM-dependent methyltransferase
MTTNSVMATPPVLRRESRSRTALAAAMLVWAGTAAGQQPAEMAAPYVPTPSAVATAMCELAGVTKRDTVVDLGSGDGRIVIEAAKHFGARGVGIDISPGLVHLANENALRAGVAPRVKFFVGDLFKTTLSQATVVFMYLLPASLAHLVPKLYEELAPGTRVVSHDYALDPLHPVKRLELDVPEKEKITGTPRTFLYLYVIAAPVAGQWSMVLPASLGGHAVFEFEQQLDHVTGYLEGDGSRAAFTDVAMNGRELRFVVQALGSQKDVHFQLAVRDSGVEGIVLVNGIELQVSGFREGQPARETGPAVRDLGGAPRSHSAPVWPIPK